MLKAQIVADLVGDQGGKNVVDVDARGSKQLHDSVPDRTLVYVGCDTLVPRTVRREGLGRPSLTLLGCSAEQLRLAISREGGQEMASPTPCPKPEIEMSIDGREFIPHEVEHLRRPPWIAVEYRARFDQATRLVLDDVLKANELL